MLNWRPPVVYKYLWKYVCLLAMVSLLAASLLRMVFKGPTYTAWNQSTVSCRPLLFILHNMSLMKVPFLIVNNVCDKYTKIPLHMFPPSALKNYSNC